jgi:hypothetical protein
MIDLEAFVASGRFGPLAPGASTADIIAAFGEPDHLEPARKSYPATLLYGEVEFRLRADRLVTVAFSLAPEAPPDAGAIEVEGLWPPEARTIDAIAALLRSNGVAWERDETMSAVLDDPQSPVWVTERGVHLGFLNGALQRVGAVYT